MSENVRIGVVGIGNMGGSHCRNLIDGNVPGGELAAICDTDPEKHGKFPGITAFQTHQDLIASGSVDAIIIATPHYDHTPIAIDGLAAGLHVLVEKPLGVHVADCQRMIVAYEQRPKQEQVFCEMFNQRTIHAHRKIKELIDGGELGELRRVQWTITNWFRTQSYYDSGGWRATWGGEGGGVLLNQCPHQLDLWQWFFGMPERIRAHCHIGKYHRIEVEDDVTAYMEYANGATGMFIASTGEAPGTNRLEICGERGRLVFENGELAFTRNEVPMSEHCATATQGFSQPGVWHVRIPVPGGGPQHVGIMQNFVDAIRGSGELMAPAPDGIKSVELANAMLYSGFTGETVALPIDAAAYEQHLQKLIAESTFEKTTATKQSDDSFANSF
ncbi:MAG: Gfo/Idh/MocA family protein [Planctomycetota bacterium]